MPIDFNRKVIHRGCTGLSASDGTDVEGVDRLEHPDGAQVVRRASRMRLDCGRN